MLFSYELIPSILVSRAAVVSTDPANMKKSSVGISVDESVNF
jgi:hypothetical protein